MSHLVLDLTGLVACHSLLESFHPELRRVRRLFELHVRLVRAAGGLRGARLLRCPRPQRHARHVRHATQDDLDCLEELLGELRKLPQLRERKRGYFSRGSHAFLHFHEDAGHFYVDVRLNGAFQRMKVTSRNEQTDFLAQLRRAVQSKS
jgi:hypothetical protein